MLKRFALLLLCALLFTSCGSTAEPSSVSAPAPAIDLSEWEVTRQKIENQISAVDVVESTFTKTEQEKQIAEILGSTLIVYPKYAQQMKDSYGPFDNEFLLLTALLGTDCLLYTSSCF